MGRKKFRTRHTVDSTRSFFAHHYFDAHALIDRHELLHLIHGGEDSYIEFKVRLNNPEKLAAEVVALANSGGGFIVIGVNDNRRIEGVDDPEWVEQQLIHICHRLVLPPIRPRINKIAFDNGKRVVALEVEGPHPPYRTADHRCYVRVGSMKREATAEEIAEMYDPHRSYGFELMPITSSTLDDIDEAIFWSYVRELRGGDLGEFEEHGYPIDEVMIHYLQLAVEFDHESAPTLAGLLLFGKNDRVAHHLPRSGIVATRLAGVEITDPIVEQTEITGNLATQFEGALAFVRRYADLLEERPPRQRLSRDGPVEPRASYARAAIVEALTNALIHRDYSLQDQVTRILIFDDRLEVINPMRVAGVALEPICCGVVSAPHPRLKAIFKSAYYGLMTVTGGVPMMLRTAQAFSGIKPEIRLVNDEFRLKIYGLR
ncbi:MAG TPA: RNA-binding domain-containing protein [Blastocatellia bacterium]|nr:RNA-binding domain-containing protein [Blastocatellia bacterium]